MRIPSRTLAGSVTLRGVGVHTGADGSARVSPAPFGTGLRLGHPGREVAVHVGNATAVPGATVLGGVSTPEHLLAALVGLGVTDAVVSVDGSEVPILDGSARPWCDAIRGVGLVDGPPAAVVRVDRTIRVSHGGSWAELRPGPRRVRVTVDYPDGPAGVLEIALGNRDFEKHVAWAPTFVLAADVDQLRAAGLGRGASAANTLVFGPDDRSDDRAVRHKLLDAVGDLALAGGPVLGTLEVVRGGHALHQAVVRALVG